LPTTAKTAREPTTPQRMIRLTGPMSSRCATNTSPINSTEAVRAILNAAGTSLRAMVLLGINGGFGNTDCARLPIAAEDRVREAVRRSAENEIQRGRCI